MVDIRLISILDEEKISKINELGFKLCENINKELNDFLILYKQKVICNYVNQPFGIYLEESENLCIINSLVGIMEQINAN